MRSEQEVTRLLELQSIPVKTVYRSANPDDHTADILGVPSFVQEAHPIHGRVFRKYFVDKSKIERVLRTQHLSADEPHSLGATIAKAFGARLFSKNYLDLEGISFVDTDSLPTNSVYPIPSNTNYDFDYVEFRLLPGTGALQIQPGLFLAPGSSQPPEWMVKLYNEYVNSKEISPQYSSLLETFMKWDAKGGINPAQLPIEIVAYRISGKTHTIVELPRTEAAPGGSNSGRWEKDEAGAFWFAKRDLSLDYPELQTSAEVIGAEIYRFFGYKTPETKKVIRDGVHWVYSKNIGSHHTPTDLLPFQDRKSRQMKFAAAYLRDFNRPGNPANNRILEDGSLVILDFGGALGSWHTGTPKRSAKFSAAIGSFSGDDSAKKMLSESDFPGYAEHPWHNVDKQDALEFVSRLRELNDELITEIVMKAQYSRIEDQTFMIQALIQRRNTLVRDLVALFDKPPRP